MLRYNRKITRTNINVLLNVGQGAGGGRKKGGKKATFPTLLTMIVVPMLHTRTLMTLFTFRLPFLQIILFIYACRTLCELFRKNSSYVSGLTECIFVAVDLYARGCLFEGIMS